MEKSWWRQKGWSQGREIGQRRSRASGDGGDDHIDAHTDDDDHHDDHIDGHTDDDHDGRDHDMTILMATMMMIHNPRSLLHLTSPMPPQSTGPPSQLVPLVIL